MFFSESLTLRGDIAKVIKSEAKAVNKSPVDFVSELITEFHESREVREAIKYNEGKGSVSAQELYKQCGI